MCTNIYRRPLLQIEKIEEQQVKTLTLVFPLLWLAGGGVAVDFSLSAFFWALLEVSIAAKVFSLVPLSR